MGENEEQRNMKYVGGSERKVAEEAVRTGNGIVYFFRRLSQFGRLVEISSPTRLCR